MSAEQQSSRFNDLMLRFVLWRQRHIKEKTFVLVLAFIVGICCGFAALLLKTLIHFISHVLTGQMNLIGGNYLYFIYPVIGILIAGWYVRYVVRDNISHGVTRVLHAISSNKSRLKGHNVYSSVVASSITIGFGGSVGAEGPIVFTGAAIGSKLGSLFRMPPRVLMLLVGCGAAAGIAGIFKAPIAGMLFTLEVLMLDLTAVSVMPLLISSISAATVAYIFTGYDVEFFFMQSESFGTARIPFVIMLGLTCGFVSLYFTRTMNMMENMFKRLERPWLKTLTGGAILSVLIFLFPPLYGEGYGAIVDLLGGDPSKIVQNSVFVSESASTLFVCLFIGAIILLKSFATSATNGGGGVGGTFAPSLYVGCMAGFLFAYAMNNALGLDLSIKNFALMGMAAVMAGTIKAPMMAVFIAAEISDSYSFILGFILVSVIAYIITARPFRLIKH